MRNLISVLGAIVLSAFAGCEFESISEEAPSHYFLNLAPGNRGMSCCSAVDEDNDKNIDFVISNPNQDYHTQRMLWIREGYTPKRSLYVQMMESSSPKTMDNEMSHNLTRMAAYASGANVCHHRSRNSSDNNYSDVKEGTETNPTE